MKKLSKPICFVTVAATMVLAPLLTITTAYADIGMPYTYEYDVIVTNPDGAKTDRCKTTDIIPNGTKLTISFDYTDSDTNETMISVKYGEEYGNCSIKSSDAEFAKKDFDLSSVSKADPLSQYILTEESYLYKGPNERYGKVDDEYRLPAGIVVTSVYHDGVWMYVEYDGHAGWIYHYNTFRKDPKTANLPTGEWSMYVMPTRNTIELKNSPFEDGEVVDTLNVEPLTVIPVTYYFYTSKYTAEVYIVYGEHSGWYLRDSNSGDVAFRTSDNGWRGIAVKDVGIAADIDSSGDSTFLSANEEFIALYYTTTTIGTGIFGQKYYIRTMTSAKEGWVDDIKYLSINSGKGYSDGRTFEQDRQLFDMVDGTPIGTIESGTYQVLYYYRVDEDMCWYYIEKQNADGSYEILGWVNDDKDEKIEELEKEKEKEIESATTYVESEVYIYPTEETETKEGSNQKVKNALLWSLVGAGIISATTICSLFIIKRRQMTKEIKGEAEPKDNTSANEEKSAELEPENDQSKPGESVDDNEESAEPSAEGPKESGESKPVDHNTGELVENEERPTERSQEESAKQDDEEANQPSLDENDDGIEENAD